MNTHEERSEIVECITDRVRSLIDGHWREIREIADEPNDKGESGDIPITLKVDLSFSGKTPAGAVNISIPPRTIRDGSTFRIEDPDEPELPIARDLRNRPQQPQTYEPNTT